MQKRLDLRLAIFFFSASRTCPSTAAFLTRFVKQEVHPLQNTSWDQFI